MYFLNERIISAIFLFRNDVGPGQHNNDDILKKICLESIPLLYFHLEYFYTTE